MDLQSGLVSFYRANKLMNPLRSVKMGKCLWNFFFFLCDVYLGFFLLVALVYLNPGFLYEKKTMPKTQTCLCFSFCFVTGTCLCYRHILVVILLSADSILSLYLVTVMD